MPTSYMVQSSVNGLRLDAKVSSFIDPVMRGWNVSLIRASFCNSEGNTICSIIPSPLGNPDKRIWMGSSSGCYSVKNGYHFEMNRRAQARGESSTSQDNKDLWQAIWWLRVPEVLKGFVWKLCHNILPTKSALFKKSVVQDPLCPVCSACSEDVWHVLWSCPASVAVCQEGPRSVQKLAMQESDGMGFVKQLRERLNEGDFIFSLIVARLVWLR